MEFTRESIQQGRANQEASVETPDSFARIEGAVQPRSEMDLASKNKRMAGPKGARALELANNPEEQARVEGWMYAFGLTNDGKKWNGDTMMEQG